MTHVIGRVQNRAGGLNREVTDLDIALARAAGVLMYARPCLAVCAGETRINLSILEYRSDSYWQRCPAQGAGRDGGLMNASVGVRPRLRFWRRPLAGWWHALERAWVLVVAGAE